MPLETTAELVRQIQDTGGVEVVYGGESSYGFFLAPGQIVHGAMGGGMVVEDPSVEVVSGAFATALKQDVAITVDGRSYTIGVFQPLTDGAMTLISLVPV